MKSERAGLEFGEKLAAELMEVAMEDGVLGEKVQWSSNPR